MGMFDTYRKSKELEVQLKAGPCCLYLYQVGDPVDIPEGVYHGNGDGIVIIRNGLLEDVLEADADTSVYSLPVFDKYGDSR